MKYIIIVGIKQIVTVRRNGSSIQSLQVMWFAKDSVFVQRELFAGRKLAAAGIASEARQMIYLLARLPYPVRRGDTSAAFRALRTEAPVDNTTESNHARVFLI